ncbi:hypothetical protein F5I97DRAFT_1930244 [Phlebopus sp. FC_14]|nr:hypothetical protein F5I97DRAFT_1930244 [Phlebopus sp. FC_14]
MESTVSILWLLTVDSSSLSRSNKWLVRFFKFQLEHFQQFSMASINISHYFDAELALHDNDLVEMVLTKTEEIFRQEQKAKEHASMETKKKYKEMAETREKVLIAARAQVEKERKQKAKEKEKTRKRGEN